MANFLDGQLQQNPAQWVDYPIPDTGEILLFYYFQNDDVPRPLGASHPHIQPLNYALNTSF